MPFDAPAAMADAIETVIKAALLPIVVRMKALEAQDGIVAELRERLATLEARPPIPGPSGPAGTAGADGLGFDDYRIEYDGERTFTHVWTKGDRLKTIVCRVPLPVYRGTFVVQKLYEQGDMVTVNGSIFHANVDTTRSPGDGSKDWTLAVKRGKDDRGPR